MLTSSSLSLAFIYQAIRKRGKVLYWYFNYLAFDKTIFIRCPFTIKNSRLTILYRILSRGDRNAHIGRRSIKALSLGLVQTEDIVIGLLFFPPNMAVWIPLPENCPSE